MISQLSQRFYHCFVYGTGTLTSSKGKEHKFFAASFGWYPLKISADRISGQECFLSKIGVALFERRCHPAAEASQQTIGKARQGVLLLKQSRNARQESHQNRRSRRITANANHN